MQYLRDIFKIQENSRVLLILMRLIELRRIKNIQQVYSQVFYANLQLTFSGRSFIFLTLLKIVRDSS